MGELVELPSKNMLGINNTQTSLHQGSTDSPITSLTLVRQERQYFSLVAGCHADWVTVHTRAHTLQLFILESRQYFSSESLIRQSHDKSRTSKLWNEYFAEERLR